MATRRTASISGFNRLIRLEGLCFVLSLAFLLAQVIHLRADAGSPATRSSAVPLAQTQPTNLPWPIGLVQQSLTTVGGNGTYTWSVIAGALPPGISLRTDLPSFFTSDASAGLIGVATTPGTYNFTLRVTSNGEIADKAETMIISALRLRDPELPAAFAGAPYSYTFGPLGNAGAVTFSSISVPAGMTLSAAGVLSGMPTSPGQTSVQFNLSDGVDTQFRSYSLPVESINVTAAGPAPAVLPNITQNVAYSTTVTASGGTGGYTYTASGLPGGLSINTTTGVISGTTNFNTGRYQVNITAKDSSNTSYTRRMAITVVGPAATLPTFGTALFVNDFTVGVPLSRTVSVSGGAAPYAWTVTGLPAGLSYRTGSGVASDFTTPGDLEIFGAPATAGTSIVTISATDGNGASVTNTFPLKVGTLFQTDLLVNGQMGVPYAKTARVVGGTPPYTMALVSGSGFPSGLNINAATQLVNGTPAEAGFFFSQFTFTDSAAQTLRMQNGYSIGTAGSGSVNINTGAALNPATTNVAYTNNLSGSGGTLIWTLTNGTLPTGLSLSSTGSITGTPTVSGVYTFTIRATDNANAANFAARVFTLNVTPLTVTTSSPLPYGNVGVAYSKSLVVTGGTGPYTWSILPFNSVPPGLTLAADGTLSGTPTETGAYTFLGSVTDSASHTRAIGFTISIYPPGGVPPVAQTQSSNFGTFSIGNVQTQLVAVGGDGINYTWSVVGGALPPGLSVRPDKPFGFSVSASAGIIGLATTPGTYNFTIRASSAGQSGDLACTMKIVAFTLKDPSPLPDAFVGNAYSYAFTPLNNAAVVTFTPTSGVPAGMTLSAAGVLSGIPTTPQNNVNVNFTINDGTNTVSRSIALTVSAIRIAASGPAPGVLPNASQGNPYSTTLTATGGTAPYTWNVANLPNGLTWDSATGVVSGTPVANAGKFQIGVTARAANNVSYTRQMSIDVTSVGAPLPGITVASAPWQHCSLGVPCSRTGAVTSGGTAPFTWSVSGLPQGMSFRFGSGITSNNVQPGDVELWGTPLVTGTFNVQLQVTDANGASATNTFPLRVSTLSQTSTGVNGTLGTPYSLSLRVIGGALPYSAVLATGSLPAGLTLNPNTLVISGTPTESGNFSPVFTYTDNAGETLRFGVFFTVNGAGSNFMTISTAGNLGSTAVGSAVNTQLFSCCANPIVWSLVSGALPNGLSLSPDGFLTGTATTSGTFTFLVKAADGGNAANFAQRQFTYVVSPLVFDFSGGLPFANVNTFYTQTLTATGGTGTITWALAAGNPLPPGLTLSTGGVLSGTPTSTGFYPFTVTATDGASHVRSTGVSLRIFAAGQGPVLGQQQNANFGTWKIGGIQTPLIAFNGDGTYTWSVIAGALPPGLSIRTDKPDFFPASASAGLIGVATTPGTYNFTLRVSSNGQNADVPSTMKITAFRLKDGHLPEMTLGQPYSHTFTALNPAGPVTWSLSGSLPTGLSFAGGVLSGTPTAAMNTFFTVTANDGVDTASDGFNVSVTLVRFTGSRALPNATSGTPYTATITVAGGVAPYTFTALTFPLPNSVGLPAGLTLNTSTGVISGTTTTSPGLYQFYVGVRDANGQGYSRPFTIDVVTATPLQPFIKPQLDLFIDCTIGEICAQAVAVDKGGVAPFSWSASGLPPGMSLRTGPAVTDWDTSPGYAEISGSPGTLGTFNVQFTVTDATGASSTNTFPLTVSALGPDSDNGGDGFLGTAFARNYSVIGGTAPYTVSLVGGSYPAGVTLSNLSASGTPVEDGLFLPVLNVTDSAAHVFRGMDFVYVNAGGNGLVNISTLGNLGSITTGTAVSRALSACCANTITWTVIGGTLPTGVQLSGSGVLFGAPTVAGTATFLVRAADQANAANQSVRQFTMSVTPMAITTVSPLANGTVGVLYTQALMATGGTGTVTWTLAPFNYLPPGMTLGSNGILSGTPTARGQFIFNVVASDQASHNFVKAISLSIVPPPNTAPTISVIANQTTNEDTATAAIAFTIGDAETAAASLTVTASSSNTTLVPNANILLGGAGASRTIKLTPAANLSGASTITVTVSDGALSTQRTFVLTVTAVNDPPTITPIANQTVNLDTPTGALAFTIGDIETSPGSLTLSGSSSDTTLVPNANIVFGGAGASRTVTVTPASGQSGAATITVTVSDGSLTSSSTFVLTVNGKPTFSVDKSSLVFAATSNGIAFTSKTGEQIVRLLQNGPGTVTWTAVSNQPWLTVSPASGAGTANLKINVVFASGLAATQGGAITITLTGAGNTVGPIAVTLNTVNANTNTAPQGTFDTPIDGTKDISGSIAVTGWAVDDVEVVRVRILRNPVSGEGSDPVFIGNAVLVEGARPDVAATFPNVPKNTVAGWGYLMLTNFLPDLGNGTFTLYAIADDADGHSTLLGTKTITCNNSAAITPTGAIDTPLQGETVSGFINNFGWVLSPGLRRADPTGGGSVRVVVDGNFLPDLPSGWVSRSDLSDLFKVAEFSGIDHALGVLGIDTTTLANGVHTIAWLVTDNSTPPQAAGIGSRYFTVANGSSSLRLAPDTAGTASVVVKNTAAMTLPATAHVDAPTLAEEIAGVTVDATTIESRKGFDPELPFSKVRMVEKRATILAEELGRVELRVRGSDGTAGVTLSGYLRGPDGELGPLPIGSQLDPASGAFTWMPGVGFSGAYDFVFVRWDHGRVIGRQEVRIVLGPRGGPLRQ